MELTIRQEANDDVTAIKTVTMAAFLNAEHTSHTEHLIVERLRNAGMLTVSLIAESHGEIVGHAAASPVTITDGTSNWFGLGPVSVEPKHQGQGIGSKLVREALSNLRKLGGMGCVVLGDPNFYQRFGFKAEPGLILLSSLRLTSQSQRKWVMRERKAQTKETR